MKFSKSFSSKSAFGALGVIIALTGCAGHTSVAGDTGIGVHGPRVAVLPLDNLSGSAAPLKMIRQELIAKLQARGMAILPDGELDAFMTRHRLRYVGGVNREDSTALRDETGASAVVVTSLELYSESNPPRIALTARLVSTGSDPRILGMESTAMAGDDAPGLLGIGRIDNAAALRAKAIDRLSTDLTAANGKKEQGPSLMPQSVFHNQPLDPEKKYSVAVLPFFNKSSRRYAGEILALHFIRELSRNSRFSVIEPGVVRQELLQYRIIMEEGVSLSDAELVLNVMRADLLLSGNVNDYAEIQGSSGAPEVDFTALMLNRDNRKAGWAVDIHAKGDEKVYLFDIGRLTTANALAAAITRGAVKTLTSTDLTVQP
jgi:hypothetical protein